MQLLLVLRSCFFLLHLDLLLDTRDLIANPQGVRLDLVAHLEGTLGCLRVAALDHFTHANLSLRQIHHLEVAADSELVFAKILIVSVRG